MPLYQQPTFHDRQCTIDETSQTTSSLTFVDVTGASLTTTDLGQPEVYVLWFSVLVSASLNNTTASFRLTVDGVPSSMDRKLFLKVKDQDVGFTFMGCAEDVGTGSVFQAEWATDNGTLTLAEYNLVIDGIPSSRVIKE